MGWYWYLKWERDCGHKMAAAHHYTLAMFDRIAVLEESLRAAHDFVNQPNDLSDEIRTAFWERVGQTADRTA